MEVIFFLIVLVIVIALICAAIAFALPFILMALIMVLFVAFLYGIGKSLIGYYSALITTYGKKSWNYHRSYADSLLAILLPFRGQKDYCSPVGLHWRFTRNHIRDLMHFGE